MSIDTVGELIEALQELPEDELLVAPVRVVHYNLGPDAARFGLAPQVGIEEYFE